METLQHKFVEFIPDVIQEKIIYVSIEYCTVVHKCVCGCGNEVVTPLSPTDWELSFNGKAVSLYPSIGNWNFECKSHYFITNNVVRNVRRWSDKKIASGREHDSQEKQKYYNKDNDEE